MFGQKFVTAAALLTTLVVSFLLTREAGHALRSVPADQTPQGVSGPIVVLGETQRDVGPVEAGVVLRARFSVENAGTRRLIIESESKACCDEPSERRQIVVPPGARRDLEIEVDTGQWHGRMRHAVHYTTNDPSRPQFTLTLHGQVQ
jgi:hypothetical protein